ncbi:MAG TPA: flagellar protein export ATPase FliI [Armatimonadota bacterium]|nr:flagellar protein export ATPase FliI [Armatimonadota bacterium]
MSQPDGAMASRLAPPPDLTPYFRAVERCDPKRLNGRTTRVVGLTIESHGPACRIGEICELARRDGPPIVAEAVGFRDQFVLLMPLDDMEGIEPGSEVRATGRCLRVPVGPGMLGRVLDGLGRPIDGGGDFEIETEYPVNARPPSPLLRSRITEPLEMGVRAIDGPLTIGRGQRVGIFAGSGVGKSTLLGMIARNTEAAVSVVGLVGERGREVREFVERDLGPQGLARSVVICATSDSPALVRLKAAFVATAVAEYFRDQGQHVLLMMDSITRVAMAQREVGLAIGEPPATRGYTPSVFAMLPRLLERSGCSSRGTITALYTVLVEGDDMNEPIADQARSILDGHIVLSRRLAQRPHYPAIDVLQSVSRAMPDIVSPSHRRAADRLRDVLATYQEAEDLINIGAYVPGSNPRIDYAQVMVQGANDFLKQDMLERTGYEEARLALESMFGQEGVS